jgi:hypothetical protein
MSISNHGTISNRNNLNLIRKASYFKNRGKEIDSSKRIGMPLKKFGVNENGYALRQERKKRMFKKGLYNFVILTFSIAVIAILTVVLMS